MATLKFDDDFSVDKYQDSVRADFTSRAESYGAGSSGEMHRQLTSELARRYPPPETGRILDIACGTGLLTACVPDQHRVTGVDLTDAMLSQARSAFPQSTFIQGSAEHLPFPDSSFACAYICSALPYFHDVSRAMRQAFRILAPGGFLAVQAVTPRSYVLGVLRADALEYVLGPATAKQVFPNMHAHTRDESACRDLFETAGFHIIHVAAVPDRSNHTINVVDIPTWWERVCMKNALFGRVRNLSPEVLDRVRARFTNLVLQQADDKGIVPDFVELMFVQGFKPKT